MSRYPVALHLGFMLAALGLSAAPAQASGDLRSGGKLLLTGGITAIEGAAGGGLASWALIAGNETDAGIGASAHVTRVELDDFGFTGYGVAIGLFDRAEISVTRQRFDTRDVGAALGLGRGFTLGQDVFGAKLRILGDAVYDQDKWLPQIAIGVQHKRARKDAVLRAVGARRTSDTDAYVAATKVLLDRSLVVNATLRLTRANQTGLLGYGGDRGDARSLEFEGSAGMLVTRRLLIGGEYRTRPSNLGIAEENNAWDVFAAYALTRNLALTAAYVDLGSIVTFDGQHGAFLQLQASF